MKEINYDEVLAPPRLKITIDKKKYEVAQPTLGQIIDYEQRVKDLMQAGESGKSGSDIGELWITVIQSIFTCIPAEVLKKKNLPLLRKIAGDCTKFMQESMWSDALAEGSGDNKKKGK